jgi:hypothetical protein
VSEEAGENTVAVGELAASIAALRAEVDDLRGLLSLRPIRDRLRSLPGRIRHALAGRTGDPTAA